MTYYEIRDADIKHNISVIKERAGVPVWGTIKYDGYGVGVCHMAELLRSCGVNRFAVSDTEDIEQLRNGGFKSEEILLLSQAVTTEEIRRVIRNRGIFAIGSLDYATLISAIVSEEGGNAEAHVVVDTGMGLEGFHPNEYNKILAVYRDFPSINVAGIGSHFARAYKGTGDTKKQYSLFMNILSQLERDGVDRKMAHICNSPGVFRFKGMRLDAVRVGSALMGRVNGTEENKTNLRRVGTLVTQVSTVRAILKGHTIGYGTEIKARRSMEVAIISAGQWDGIPCRGILDRLTNRFKMAEINGHRVPIISVSGEGHAEADVTGLDIKLGDIVRIDINPLRLNCGIRKIYI